MTSEPSPAHVFQEADDHDVVSMIIQEHFPGPSLIDNDVEEQEQPESNQENKEPHQQQLLQQPQEEEEVVGVAAAAAAAAAAASFDDLSYPNLPAWDGTYEDTDDDSSGDTTLSMHSQSIAEAINNPDYYYYDNWEEDSLSSMEEDEDEDEDEEEDRSSRRHGYELQPAHSINNPITVGSFVFVPWPWPSNNSKNNCQAKQEEATTYYWGNVTKAYPQRQTFDIQFLDRCISKNVHMDQILTLESMQYKDSMLEIGSIVYAPWPGISPETEFYYWGRISKIDTYKTRSNKYTIHFFPDSDIVDVTNKLDAKYLHRREEAEYLMSSAERQLAQDKLPSNLIPVEDLVAMEEQAKKKKKKMDSRKPLKSLVSIKKAKARTNAATIAKSPIKRSPKTAAKTANRRPAKPLASAKAPPTVITTTTTRKKQPTTSRKTSTNKRTASSTSIIITANNKRCKEGMPAADACDSFQEGDLIYAPFPNQDPANEPRYWGSIRNVYKMGKNVYVDVAFEGGEFSTKVLSQHLYQLESQTYKDSVAGIGDVVYAPFPGKNPKEECKSSPCFLPIGLRGSLPDVSLPPSLLAMCVLLAYYWGRISTIKANLTTGTPPLYTIDFWDGDVTLNLESTHFHFYDECMNLMEKGFIAKDEPPKSILLRNKK
eukprot:scaffold3297_cov132-Cylindrotheca_fusiformis.AAC.2